MIPPRSSPHRRPLARARSAPAPLGLLDAPARTPTLPVRWLHLLAATVAVGGSVLTRALLRAGRFGPDDARFVARGYEWGWRTVLPLAPEDRP